MKFDKSKVYTAANAEDLPVRSFCIFADTMKELQRAVNRDYSVHELKDILDQGKEERFVSDDGAHYSLAYFVECDGAQTYRAFDNVGQAMLAINNHGGWVKNRAGTLLLVTGYVPDVPGEPLAEPSDDTIRIADRWVSLKYLYRNYCFYDDGTPCGELLEQ